MSDKQTPQEAWAHFTATLRAAVKPDLLRLINGTDRLLRRWPWLYRKLGG